MNVTLYGDEKEPAALGLTQPPETLLIVGNLAGHHLIPQRLH
jgi:hypothetical protein